jgi:hypothetical protein
MNIARIVATAFLILTLSGCATPPPPVYVRDVLPVPPAPALPRIADDELDCLSDDTLERLKLRETRLRGHIRALEGVIETHNTTGGK